MRFWSMLLLLLSVLATGYSKWNIDLSQYEHRMSITCAFKIDQEFSRDTADRVGAFVDGELRGVGKISFFDSKNGSGIAFFQVGSNFSSGEEIEFLLYDADRKRELKATISMEYEASDIHGSVSEPVIFSNTEIYPEGDLLYNNYISPNNDGINDYLFIEKVERYEGFKLTVYTIDGHQVYQKEDYQNDWGGEYRGSILPLGEYYFRFENQRLDKVFFGSFSIKSR